MRDTDFIEVEYFVEDEAGGGTFQTYDFKDFVGFFTNDLVTVNLIVKLYEKGLLTNDELLNILGVGYEYNINQIEIKEKL